MKVILIGFMLSGKSAIGKQLANRLGYQFVDMDELIVRQEGMPIKDIFSRYGEEHFREIEHQMTQRLATADNMVIATGGGVVMRDDNMRNLKAGNSFCVYLKVQPETVLERKNDDSRPLLNVGDVRKQIEELMSRREGLYQKYADMVITTDDKTIQEIVQKIEEELWNAYKAS